MGNRPRAFSDRNTVMKNITVRYGIETLSAQVDCEATVGDILANNKFRAGLGFGDNVRCLNNGVALPSEAIVPDGSELVVETKCNSKAQDTKLVSVRYGIEEMELALPYAATFADMKRSTKLRAGLGFGDNIRALVNGVEMPDTAQVPNGGTVVIETKCNSKAS